MRGAAAFVLAMSASLLVSGSAFAQRSTSGTAPPLVPDQAPAAAPAIANTTGQPATRAAAPAPAPAAKGAASATCNNPNALGVTRTVEIDTTGGPGFGFEHFRQHDFLRDKEVVLTFDDGPWPTTPAVLKAWRAQCADQLKRFDTSRVGALQDVSVDGGTGGWYLLTYGPVTGDPDADFFDAQGLAVVGTRIAMVEMVLAGQDYNYEAGQEPMVAAVQQAASKLG